MKQNKRQAAKAELQGQKPVCHCVRTEMIGAQTFGEVLVMLLQIPVVTFVSRRIKLAQRTLMKIKDERVKAAREMVTRGAYYPRIELYFKVAAMLGSTISRHVCVDVCWNVK